MNPAVLFALWTLAASTILSGQWFIHRRFTAAMETEVRKFEKAWQDLEAYHDKI